MFDEMENAERVRNVLGDMLRGKHEGPGKAPLLVTMWILAGFPLDVISAEHWRILWHSVGYVDNFWPAKRSGAPVRLYRGAPADGARGWSWSLNLESTYRFATRDGATSTSGRLWTTLAPPEALFAILPQTADREAVVDPDLLGDIEPADSRFTPRAGSMLRKGAPTFDPAMLHERMARDARADGVERTPHEPQRSGRLVLPSSGPSGADLERLASVLNPPPQPETMWNRVMGG